ncbi:tetratricopeptide repeat protein [Bacillaceae bacterium S4-13-58]
MNKIEEAMNLMEIGLTEKAINELKLFIPHAKDEEKFEVGTLFLQWGLLNDAEAIFLDLKELYPEENELDLLLAEIYIEWEEDDRALDRLHHIDKENDFYIQALLQMADLYQSQGLFEVAEQKLQEAKRIAPEERLLDFALGELAFSSGEYKKAISYYEKVANSNLHIEDVDVTQRLAEAYAMTGSFEEALDFFDKTEHEEPDTLFQFGFTAWKQENFERAIQIWKKLINVDPDYHSVYPLLSEALEEEGRIEEAYNIAKKGIERDEYNQQLFYHTGKLAFRLNKVEEAIQFIREAIAFDPGYKEAVMYLVELFKQNDMDDELVDLITDTIKFGEEDPLYFWERARAYQRLEEYSYALNDYTEAYNSLKEDLEFLKEYGYFLLEEGKLNMASQILRSYLENEPTDMEVHELVERISGEAN